MSHIHRRCVQQLARVCGRMGVQPRAARRDLRARDAVLHHALGDLSRPGGDAHGDYCAV